MLPSRLLAEWRKFSSQKNLEQNVPRVLRTYCPGAILPSFRCRRYRCDLRVRHARSCRGPIRRRKHTEIHPYSSYRSTPVLSTSAQRQLRSGDTVLRGRFSSMQPSFELGVQSFPLAGLPPEILEQILLSLPPADILRLREVSTICGTTSILVHN